MKLKADGDNVKQFLEGGVWPHPVYLTIGCAFGRPKLARKFAASLEMYLALKALGCVCEHGAGNPMMSSHSEKCKAAREAVRKADEG